MEAIRAVQNAIDFMEDHLFEHLELEQIAAAAFMSVPSMYRVFYALTGHPLKEYIRKRRTSQAAMLLRQSDTLVLEVAFACGFDSYQTFTKSFKKLTGLTPGIYRKTTLYYSFERVNLLEKCPYMEKKELTEQYPEVKVIRMGEMNVISYLHRSSIKLILEQEAFKFFYQLLERLGLNLGQSRIFGRNLDDLEMDGIYAYQMMVSLSEPVIIAHPDLDVEYFPGGIFAVSLTPYETPTTILAAWNRLLSEWLPRSAFTLGDHSFLEEFNHYKGKVTRLRLFLPVQRKKMQETIEVNELQSVSILSFRSYGTDSQSEADDRLTAWLKEHSLTNKDELQMCMSFSYGHLPSDDYWYELGILLPQDFSVPTSGSHVWRDLDGGLYASLTTAAYGTMTGVLDQLYSWLYHNDQFRHDETRHWYARYIPGMCEELDRTTLVTCYVPVIVKS
jgi:AraC family transcriptional regulator